MVGHVQILFLNNLNFCKGQNDFSTLNIHILRKYRYQIKNVICEHMYLVVTTRYEIFDDTFVNRKWIFHIFEWGFFLALVLTNKSHLKRWANLASNGISTRLNWVRIIRVWQKWHKENYTYIYTHAMILVD